MFRKALIVSAVGVGAVLFATTLRAQSLGDIAAAEAKRLGAATAQANQGKEDNDKSDPKKGKEESSTSDTSNGDVTSVRLPAQRRQYEPSLGELAARQGAPEKKATAKTITNADLHIKAVDSSDPYHAALAAAEEVRAAYAGLTPKEGEKLTYERNLKFNEQGEALFKKMYAVNPQEVLAIRPLYPLTDKALADGLDTAIKSGDVLRIRAFNREIAIRASARR